MMTMDQWQEWRRSSKFLFPTIVIWSLMIRIVYSNRRTKLNIGRSVTGFYGWNKKLYDFVQDNPAVRPMDIRYVNDTSIIRQNLKTTPINSAIQVDNRPGLCWFDWYLPIFRYRWANGFYALFRAQFETEGKSPDFSIGHPDHKQYLERSFYGRYK